MSKAVTFLRMAPRDRYLLLKVAVLLAAVRLGLWVLPFQFLCDLLARVKGAKTELHSSNTASVQRIIRSIRTMSPYIPCASCLTQALTALVLMGRLGCPANLRIGVVKGEKGNLKAHAWVESQGRIVIGKLAGLSRYTVLSSTQNITL